MARQYRQVRINPDSQTPSRFGEFTGIVNTRSRKAIGFNSLTVADNVFLSDDKKVIRRPGYAAFFSGAVRGGFTIGSDVYLDDAGTLKHRVGPSDIRVVTTGLTGTRYDCTTINGLGYFCNGVESGVVHGDVYQPLRIQAPAITSVTLLDTGPAATGSHNIGDRYATATWRFCATYETADGREGPPSDVFEVAAPPLSRLFRFAIAPGYAKTHIYATEADGTSYRRIASTVAAQTTATPALVGRVLTTYGTYPLPSATERLCFYLGKLYAATYDNAGDVSVLWFSTAFGFHLFKLGRDHYVLPGRVTFMAAAGDDVLVVGTTRGAYQIKGGALHEDAAYGVLQGEVDAE